MFEGAFGCCKYLFVHVLFLFEYRFDTKAYDLNFVSVKEHI
jgi:hypothetical protein